MSMAMLRILVQQPKQFHGAYQKLYPMGLRWWLPELLQLMVYDHRVLVCTFVDAYVGKGADWPGNAV